MKRTRAMTNVKDAEREYEDETDDVRNREDERDERE